jgi:hypothetical protein
MKDAIFAKSHGREEAPREPSLRAWFTINANAAKNNRGN